MVINHLLNSDDPPSRKLFFLGGNVFFVCFFLLTYFGCPEVITPEKWSYILHLTYNRVFRGPILRPKRSA